MFAVFLLICSGAVDCCGNDGVQLLASGYIYPNTQLSRHLKGGIAGSRACEHDVTSIDPAVITQPGMARKLK